MSAVSILATPADRRRPGRVRLGIGSEPATQVERLISMYEALLSESDLVLLEGRDLARDELRRIRAYRTQFEMQLRRWRAVKARADAIVDVART